MDRLRIVVDAALTNGAIAAQAVHGMVAFSVAHPEAYAAWHTGSNTIVILAVEAEELAALAEQLELDGVKTARFYEPDRGDALTAIAIAPSQRAKEATAHLALAGAPPRRVKRCGEVSAVG